MAAMSMFQAAQNRQFLRRGITMRMKAVRNVPLFPLVPIVPAVLIVSSLVIAIRALMQVRRLERRINAAPVV
jgi:hypothetical protein